MKIIRSRKLNIKNCYVLLISLIAFASLLGNLYQDTFYNKALNVQEQTLAEYTKDSNVMVDYKK